jgi:hypothetical protein
VWSGPIRTQTSRRWLNCLDAVQSRVPRAARRLARGVLRWHVTGCLLLGMFGFAPLSESPGLIPSAQSGVILHVGVLGTLVFNLPSAQSEVIHTLKSEDVPITGVTSDGAFYQIQFNGHASGWVRSVMGMVATIRGDVARLPVLPLPPMITVNPLGIPVWVSSVSAKIPVAILRDIQIPVLGVSSDGFFYRVYYRGGRKGWVRTALRDGGKIKGDVSKLPVITINPITGRVPES